MAETRLEHQEHRWTEWRYKHGILEVRVPLTAAQPTEGRHISVRQA